MPKKTPSDDIIAESSSTWEKITTDLRLLIFSFLPAYDLLKGKTTHEIGICLTLFQCSPLQQTLFASASPTLFFLTNYSHIIAERHQALVNRMHSNLDSTHSIAAHGRSVGEEPSAGDRAPGCISHLISVVQQQPTAERHSIKLLEIVSRHWAVIKDNAQAAAWFNRLFLFATTSQSANDIARRQEERTYFIDKLLNKRVGDDDEEELKQLDIDVLDRWLTEFPTYRALDLIPSIVASQPKEALYDVAECVSNYINTLGLTGFRTIILLARILKEFECEGLGKDFADVLIQTPFARQCYSELKMEHGLFQNKLLAYSGIREIRCELVIQTMETARIFPLGIALEDLRHAFARKKNIILDSTSVDGLGAIDDFRHEWDQLCLYLLAGCDLNLEVKMLEIISCDVTEPMSISLLLAAGADINHPNVQGDTALMVATRYGKEAIVRQLLAASADMEIQRDQHADTALIIASKGGKDSIVSQLLEAGADINHPNVQGDTALIVATKHGKEAVVLQLLEAGADINYPNIRGDTALIVAIKHGKEAIVLQLLEAGADINHPNVQGDTALIAATKHGKEAVVLQLLEAGADINHPNVQGDTALELAERYHKSSVVRLLTEHANARQTLHV